MDVSIVIPFLNESPNLKPLCEELKAALDPMNKDYEVLFIDTGEIVVTLDADRQNDPADIPAMIAKVEEGYDMACGWRHDRQDTYVSRKLPSMLANKLISRITDVGLHDYGCTLKAMRKSLAKRVTLYGASIAEVKVNHRARTAGESKYGISRTFRVILDLITVKFLLRFHARPLHFFRA